MPTDYKCTLTWDGNLNLKIEYDPAKKVFNVHDTIAFVAIGGDITLDFFDGSPFLLSGTQEIIVKPGDPLIKREILRAAHQYVYSSPGARDENGDLPVSSRKPGDTPVDHKCLINVVKGRITVTRNPSKGLFRVGDTIEFTSPDQDVILTFAEAQPFDIPEIPPFKIAKGSTKRKTINRPSFPFRCKPGGDELPPGVGGDDVPTDGGGL